MLIDQDIQSNMKTQRLRALQAQYYEYLMNKAAFEANGKNVEAEEMIRKMAECEKSYNAVKALEIVFPEEPEEVEEETEPVEPEETQNNEVTGE